MLRFICWMMLFACAGANRSAGVEEMQAEGVEDTCLTVGNDWRPMAPNGWAEVRESAPFLVNPANIDFKYHSDRVGVVLVDSLDGPAICSFLRRFNAHVVGQRARGDDQQPMYVLAVPVLGHTFAEFTESMDRLRADPQVHLVLPLAIGERLRYPGDVH
jgi:hypothetical protein